MNKNKPVYSIKEKDIAESLTNLKSPRAKLNYFISLAESIDRGSMKIEEEAKKTLYNKIAQAYLNVDDRTREENGQKIEVIFDDASHYFGTNHDKTRKELFEELAHDAFNSHKRKDREYHEIKGSEIYKGIDRKLGNRPKVGQQATAVLLAGGLIFAARSMTGNVVSSPVSVGGEIIGSLLVGTLLVGIVWLVLTRLTTKP